MSEILGVIRCAGGIILLYLLWDVSPVQTHETLNAQVFRSIIESLGAGYISPQWKDVIAYALLALTLIVRPTGLLGERVAEKL